MCQLRFTGFSDIGVTKTAKQDSFALFAVREIVSGIYSRWRTHKYLDWLHLLQNRNRQLLTLRQLMNSVAMENAS